MFGVLFCVMCLALANFGVEAFREVPNYVEAGHVTWSQLWAVCIYYVVWAEK